MTDRDEGVLKLAPGEDEPTRLPFTDFGWPTSVGVDDAGNVYLASGPGPMEAGGGRVKKLAPDGSITELPFAGLGERGPDIAVAADGTVYAAVGDNDTVLKLPPGAARAEELPFTGLDFPTSVAVDSQGNVYVADYGNSRVVVLAPGATTQTVLDVKQPPAGVAVDGSGNVYAHTGEGLKSDHADIKVLAKNSERALIVPVNDMYRPEAIAVDTHGSIYAVDAINRVIVLKV